MPWLRVKTEERGHRATESVKLRVWNRTRGTLVGDSIGVAETSAQRRTGLLDRAALGDGEGLWLAPCEAVHCFFMKFTIDVVFLDRDNRVVKCRPSLKPWRIAVSLRAHSVLELPEGRIAATGTRPGDQLEISPA